MLVEFYGLPFYLFAPQVLYMFVFVTKCSLNFFSMKYVKRFLCFAMTADRKMKAAKAAFDTSVDCGITFFDTAEVYGSRVRSGYYFQFLLTKQQWETYRHQCVFGSSHLEP
jgi:predicted oxidoreductase